MIKRIIYIITLLSFLLIGSCDKHDFVSPYDITSSTSSPTNLVFTQLSVTSCKLTWEDNSLIEDGYRIARKKDDEDWVDDYAVLAEDSEEFIDDSILLFSTYSYRVSAFYQETSSDFAEVSIGIAPENFVLVPSGTFTMGRTSGEGNSNELPTHQVTLSTFVIGKYEVTQAQYLAVMGTNPSYFTASDKPVERVTWFNAVAYCNALSIQEGLTPCYNTSNWSCDISANGYRLPTEAEWEHAARGARNNPDYLYAGSNDLAGVAWHSSNSGNTTHSVGTKAPNSIGIYDMSGNVWEWCNDWYGSYSSGSQTDPLGPTSGSCRVYRGGSWFSNATYCRLAYRIINYPTFSYYNIGFRLARSSN